MNDYDILDYGARGMYPAMMRFTTIDPLAEKYYSISPYAYCANNPICYIDPDGRDINFYNITKSDNRGNPVSKRGLSTTTNAAVKDMVKTKEGRDFFGLYAKAGDVIGEHEYTKDGELSNVNLNLWDYSYEDGATPTSVMSGSGSINLSDDKKTMTLKVVSADTDKATVGATLTHENQLHGFKYPDKIKGKITVNEEKDHKALKNKDLKHQGYKQYKSMQDQLVKLDKAYKQSFKEADDEAQEY